MVTSFDEIPKRAFTFLKIQEVGTERPTRNKLERVDERVAKMGGFAFRSGLASGEPSLNTYNYGYVLPAGITIDAHDLTDLKSDLKDIGLDRPWVRVKSIWVDGEDLDRMELVGTPPGEALSALQDFMDDFEDYYDG